MRSLLTIISGFFNGRKPEAETQAGTLNSPGMTLTESIRDQVPFSTSLATSAVIADSNDADNNSVCEGNIDSAESSDDSSGDSGGGDCGGWDSGGGGWS